MNEKIIEILSRAKDWMDAKSIAAAGHWRSAGNVAVALKALEKSGVVECRSLGKDADRVWKHVDKDFSVPEKPKANPPKRQETETDWRSALATLEADLRAARHAAGNHEMAATLTKQYVDELEAKLADRDSEIARLKTELDAMQRVAIHTMEASIPNIASAHQKAKQAAPRRPFTVTGLSGYHTTAGKVTLFLDRRLSAKSITLPADKLNQLADMARAS